MDTIYINAAFCRKSNIVMHVDSCAVFWQLCACVDRLLFIVCTAVAHYKETKTKLS